MSVSPSGGARSLPSRLISIALTASMLASFMTLSLPAPASANDIPVCNGAQECPLLRVQKQADEDPIHTSEEASFTITVWNAGDGDAFDVELHDDLPVGLVWNVEIVQDPDDGIIGEEVACGMSSSALPGQEPAMSLDCDLHTVEPVSQANGIKIRIFADTDRTDCGVMENTAEVDASNVVEQLEVLGTVIEPGDVLTSTDTITVFCPVIELEKVADVEVITISGPANAQIATPSVVTWTLSYTLTNAPVTNAVITDEVPDGVVYVPGSASDGGVFDATTNSLTWTFPTLTTSGSVAFQTTVDVATIARTAPTVNVAVIDSDQTEPDEGQDSIRVVAEPPPLGGTPTPRPSLPNTALGTGIGGEPVNVPIELLVVVFLGSLGALAFANVRARRR